MTYFQQLTQYQVNRQVSRRNIDPTRKQRWADEGVPTWKQGWGQLQNQARDQVNDIAINPAVENAFNQIRARCW